MPNKINFVLGTCGHLPSGSGEEEFEALYHSQLKPLISTLYKFPRLNMTFHYSGVLLSWIERRHPELFMLLGDLLSRKQAEFLGGGFYEPFMPMLPAADKIGQIEMLTTYLRRQFGKRPLGCWLPGFGWEQNVAGTLNTSGMSYTFLDEKQFSGAGASLWGDGFFAPCVTEDQGKLVTVIPVASCLHREFEEMRPEEVLKKALDLSGGRDGLIAIFPRALGGRELAPELAYHQVFETLSGADSRIEFTTPGKICRSFKGLKKVYFSASWKNGGSSGFAVPEDGEICSQTRKILSDHPEANGIYTKMIYVRAMNNQLRGDKSRKRTALEELWKAQDGGVFHPEGLHRSPIRKAAYRALLEAEKIGREKENFVPSLSVFDIDLDGEGEYLFQGEELNCYIRTEGASVFELDYLPGSWNYLDTYSPGKKGFRRSAFSDWFLPPHGDALSPGGRFCGAESFEVLEANRAHRKGRFRLAPRPDIPLGAVEMEKTYGQKANTLSVEYLLTNTGPGDEAFSFIPGLDLSFSGEAGLRILLSREKKEVFVPGGKAEKIRGLEFQDLKNESLISFESDRDFDLTVQVSRGPGEDEYQSHWIKPLFSLRLGSGETWGTVFNLRISS